MASGDTMMEQLRTVQRYSEPWGEPSIKNAGAYPGKKSGVTVQEGVCEHWRTAMNPDVMHKL